MAEYTDRYDVGSLESTERQYSDFQLIKRIITDYTLEYRSIFLLVTTLVFAKMLLVIASPYLLRVTIDYYINNKPPVEVDPIAGFIEYTARMLTGLSTPNIEVLLMSAAILFVIISILQWVVNSLQTYYIEKLGLLVIADIRGDFFSHLGQLSQSFFEHGNTGKLVSRVTNDAESLKKILSTGVVGLFADTLMVVAILLLMASMDLQLTLIVLIIAPLLAGVSRAFQGLIKNAWRVARRNVASLTGKVQDLMYGAKVTKALTQEERSLHEFDEVNEQNMQAQIRAETVSVAFSSTVILLSSIMTAAIWYLGGLQVLLASRTLGQLVAFNQYASSFFSPIRSLSLLYGEIQSALSGAERIFSVLDIKPDVLEASNPVDLEDVEGHLVFKDVSFSYVQDRSVLSDVSFETIPGERLALFGPTGAGKSTIINLVGRFYDPKKGIITIDGVNLRDISFRSLRKTVSIVLQEPFLFSGSIEYNLKFGRPEATNEEMIRVAKLLGIHDTISKFREKYVTEIMERGANLSFGQQQLICLGRAILADPRILIFDEATSSVDPYTESMIQYALREEMINRTVIIITHRVSTVRDADRIILLNEGRIEDKGNHEELNERSSLYRKLCEMQLVEIK